MGWGNSQPAQPFKADTLGRVDGVHLPIMSQQLLPYSGRLASDASRTSNLVSTFSASEFLFSNGAVIQQHSKFINNNSTYGGTAGALDAEVVNLLTAMGGITTRYGTEFFVAKITAGTGVNASKLCLDGVVRYLQFGLLGTQAIMDPVIGNTTSIWAKPLSGTWALLNRLSYVNGENTAMSSTTAFRSGWNHYLAHYTGVAYDSSPLYVGAEPNSELLVALPVYLPYKSKFIHRGPVL